MSGERSSGLLKRRKTVRDPVERQRKNRERAEAAPKGFVTRPVLREKVGLTEAQLRALTSNGVVKSDGVNSSGYALYTTATLTRLLMMKGDGSLFSAVSSAAAATPNVASAAASSILPYSAEDGVRVFALLHKGETEVDIILATGIHPLVVKTIRIDYDEIAGAVHLPKELVNKINELGNAGKLPGGFPVREANDLFQVIEFCASDRTCSTCETNPALTSCESCLLQERRRALAQKSGQRDG